MNLYGSMLAKVFVCTIALNNGYVSSLFDSIVCTMCTCFRVCHRSCAHAHLFVGGCEREYVCMCGGSDSGDGGGNSGNKEVKTPTENVEMDQKSEIERLSVYDETSGKLFLPIELMHFMCVSNIYNQPASQPTNQSTNEPKPFQAFAFCEYRLVRLNSNSQNCNADYLHRTQKRKKNKETLQIYEIQHIE